MFALGLDEPMATDKLRITPSRQRRTRVAAGLVAAAALIAAACSDTDGSGSRTADDSVTEGQPRGEEGRGEEGRGEEGRGEEGNLPIAEATATAIADGSQADIDKLVAADAYVDFMAGITSTADLAHPANSGFVPWEFQFDFQGCIHDAELPGDWEFVCEVSMSTAWTRELGITPGDAGIMLKLEDGVVTGVRWTGEQDFARRIVEPFKAYVREQSNDDFVTLFVESDDERTEGERAARIALEERYIDEYVAAESGS